MRERHMTRREPVHGGVSKALSDAIGDSIACAMKETSPTACSQALANIRDVVDAYLRGALTDDEAIAGLMPRSRVRPRS
jgi:hypothetical protein